MPLSPFATQPYCLDSEFLPRPLLATGLAGLSPSIERKRAKAAHREFIRSLIFSPQVLVGRQATSAHPIFVGAFQRRSERAAIEKLLENDRLCILLMISRGKKGDRYEERSLLDFFEHSQFRSDSATEQGWRNLIDNIGDSAIPYVRLDALKSRAMENRFTSFFQLPASDPSLESVFRDSIGRTPLAEELRNLRTFWNEDLRQFYRWLQDQGQDSLYRKTIYDEYIRPTGDSRFLKSLRSKRTKLTALRKALCLPFKLMTDLAYNANTPATLNIKSFVPPDLPDPSGLPLHLYQPAQFHNPENEAHEAAVQSAYKELVARRIAAGERFFYESQTYEQLPDVGSFSLSDAVKVMEWPEWDAFKYAQRAALRFQHAEELEKLLRDYWKTVKALHDRLAREARRRTTWRRAGSGAVTLSIAVMAHVMGHSLLPDLVHHAPWWATVAGAVGVEQSLHAGLDIVVHGASAAKKTILTELGFKDGGMREFRVSAAMRDKLEELKDAERNLAKARRIQDARLATAAQRIATEG